MLYTGLYDSNVSVEISISGCTGCPDLVLYTGLYDSNVSVEISISGCTGRPDLVLFTGLYESNVSVEISISGCTGVLVRPCSRQYRPGRTGSGTNADGGCGIRVWNLEGYVHCI